MEVHNDLVRNISSNHPVRAVDDLVPRKESPQDQNTGISDDLRVGASHEWLMVRETCSVRFGCKVSLRDSFCCEDSGLCPYFVADQNTEPVLDNTHLQHVHGILYSTNVALLDALSTECVNSYQYRVM